MRGALRVHFVEQHELFPRPVRGISCGILWSMVFVEVGGIPGRKAAGDLHAGYISHCLEAGTTFLPSIGKAGKGALLPAVMLEPEMIHMAEDGMGKQVKKNRKYCMKILPDL